MTSGRQSATAYRRVRSLGVTAIVTGAALAFFSALFLLLPAAETPEPSSTGHYRIEVGDPGDGCDPAIVYVDRESGRQAECRGLPGQPTPTVQPGAQRLSEAERSELLGLARSLAPIDDADADRLKQRADQIAQRHGESPPRSERQAVEAVTAVTLPAGGSLFVLGLLGMLFLNRRAR
jgi:hypothetical protein